MSSKSKIQKFVSVTIASFILLMSGCGSAKKIEIVTDPVGAEVLDTSGELLGQTPITLEGEKFTKATTDGRLHVVVVHPDFAMRELSLDITGRDRHEINLSRLESGDFQEKALGRVRGRINTVARGLLRAQGLILTSDLDGATRELDVVEKTYPNLASVFVLKATIARIKGDSEGAFQLLQRAKQLDPNDSEMSRLLETLKVDKK